MKIWERRLMKDFQVAPVEQPDDVEEVGEPNVNIGESPLERFRRISKLVASQSANIKWNEVIRGATIEAHSQIGRCRNRESFKNQQTLMKAMEQARRLIEQSPSCPSPNHSTYSYNIDQTNQTLVQLLKNISEEINEISPQNTLHVKSSRNRSVTPLNALNAQLQTLISKSPSPYATRIKPKAQATSPKQESLNVRSGSLDGILSPSPRHTPQTSSSPSSRSETPKSPLAKPQAILKSRSPTPDSGRSFDEIPQIGVEEVKPSSPIKPESPKLIDLKENSIYDETCPLKQANSNGSPVKVVKRKAPKPEASQDIIISRPAVSRIQGNQGMIPPPPARDEIKPLQIPTFSTTPATPLFPQKPIFLKPDVKFETPNSMNVNEVKQPEKDEGAKVKVDPPVDVKLEEPVEVKADPTSTPAMIATSSSPVTHSSTELLIPDVKQPPPSPACLRPANKVEDVKTIKRQQKAGWL